MRSTLFPAMIGVLSVLLTLHVDAQKKGGPTSVTYEPAGAVFACSGSSGAPDFLCGHGIQGDGGDYRGDTTSLEGMFLRTWSSPLYRDFWLVLANSTRRLYLDFGQPANVPPCAATNSCKRDFSFAEVASTQPGGAVIRPVNTTAPHIPASGDLPGGLLALVQGDTAFAGIKLNFPDPRAVPKRHQVVWTVRFNPGSFAGSCYVAVSCPVATMAGAACERWIVQPDPACSQATLVQSPDGSVRGQVDEGLYYMPFTLTVTR